MEMIGIIVEHSRDIFRVQVENTDQIVIAKLSGKMRQNKIDLQVGDRVKMEVSPYDTSMGRITYRVNSAREYYHTDNENGTASAGSTRDKRDRPRRQRRLEEDYG